MFAIDKKFQKHFIISRISVHMNMNMYVNMYTYFR